MELTIFKNKTTSPKNVQKRTRMRDESGTKKKELQQANKRHQYQQLK